MGVGKGRGHLALPGGSRLGMLPGLIFRLSWHTDNNVLGLPLGIQMLQSLHLENSG